MPVAPPAIPIFPAGYGPLAVDFNGWVQAPFQFLSTGVVFRAERHASQTLTASSNTIVQYDTVLEDPYSGWNSGTFAWLAPYTGWYEVTVTNIPTAIAGEVGALIKTPEGTPKFTNLTMSATLSGGATASQICPLIGGVDTVQGSFFISVAGTTSTVNGRYSTIEITFVSE